MTLNTFITTLIIFSLISGLFTEAIKKSFKSMNKKISINLIALLNAAVVGCGGMVAYYIMQDIPFTKENIVFIGTMIFCVWIGSMVGYDKVIQLIEQSIFKK